MNIEKGISQQEKTSDNDKLLAVIRSGKVEGRSLDGFIDEAIDYLDQASSETGNIVKSQHVKSLVIDNLIQSMGLTGIDLSQEPLASEISNFNNKTVFPKLTKRRLSLKKRQRSGDKKIKLYDFKPYEAGEEKEWGNKGLPVGDR